LAFPKVTAAAKVAAAMARMIWMASIEGSPRTVVQIVRLIALYGVTTHENPERCIAPVGTLEL
jgi:hypothetical protein